MTAILLFMSGSEVFIILLVVLLLFGSKKIPELARGLGKGMQEFKRATDDIKKELNQSTAEIRQSTNKIRKDFDEVKKNLEEAPQVKDKPAPTEKTSDKREPIERSDENLSEQLAPPPVGDKPGSEKSTDSTAENDAEGPEEEMEPKKDSDSTQETKSKYGKYNLPSDDIQDEYGD